MLSLEQVQQDIMQAIALGPDHAPGALFRGGRSQALRGLSVHANTISHARLVALEATFPRTRCLLGEGPFNRLSRNFIESGKAGALRLTEIGRDFPAWLATIDQSVAAISIARFEWAWLQCYHAAETPVIALADLAVLGEKGIAGLVLARHPASAALELDVEARAVLDHGLSETAVLIARPEAEVVVTALPPAAARLYAALSYRTAICNLLAELDEPDGEQALLALIAAGAIIRVEETNPPC